MEKRDVGGYVWFGTCIRYLQDVETGWFLRSPAGILTNLEEFFRWSEYLQLTVTSRTRAFGSLQEIRNRLEAASGDDPERQCSPSEASELRQAVSQVRETLEAELRGRVAYVTNEKRIDVRKLQEDVRALVAPGTYDKLSPVAQLDLDVSGQVHRFRATNGCGLSFDACH